jgi:hypothetical protein
MSEATKTQDLLSMWQRSMEQNIDSWKTLIGQPQKPDMFQFWSQSLEAWTRALQQGANTPDVIAQWKKFMDEAVEAWSKVLEEAMETEAFAAAMGRSLDQYLNTVGPIRKSLQSGSEEVLRTMNLPSRKQITGLASQIVSLDARLEAIEEWIEGLGEELSSLRASMKQAEPPRTDPARSPEQGEISQRTSQKEV